MYVESLTTDLMVLRRNRVGRVYIFQVGGNGESFEFPYGPKEVTYSGSGLEYREVQRPGKQALLTAVAPRNRTVALSAVIADRSTQGCGSVESQLDTLRGLARTDADLLFIHGGVHLGFLVRIVQLTITSLERTLNGEISRAMADINFQESVSINTRVSSMEAITEEPTTPNEVDSTGDPNMMGDAAATAGLSDLASVDDIHNRHDTPNIKHETDASAGEAVTAILVGGESSGPRS
jgi:hypothetical protein